VVALTFDDGPDAEHTPEILDLLEAHGVRATFFVFGTKARREPDLIARALAAGHRIEPHCWASHASHFSLSAAELDAEIGRTLSALAELGCPAPSLWRPPYGDVKEPESHEAAARHDLRIVTWTLDTRDWDDDGGALTLEQVDAQLEPDSVVLLHDWPLRTPALLRGLLERMKARGWATGPMA
jgi:peptidoglycan/xylan/chitin deacetylase (PgdA/CDA1 family)